MYFVKCLLISSHKCVHPRCGCGTYNNDNKILSQTKIPLLPPALLCRRLDDPSYFPVQGGRGFGHAYDVDSLGADDQHNYILRVCAGINEFALGENLVRLVIERGGFGQ